MLYIILPNASTRRVRAACPVEAIFEEDAVPDKWGYIKNYDYYKND